MSTLTPIGRIVQGGVALQQLRDAENNNVLLKNDDGSPKMGVVLVLAFPKVLPGTGMPNAEFENFRHNVIGQLAASSWPALFPNGYRPDLPNYGCVLSDFSWKIRDGDGHDKEGKPLSAKPGFGGHWIVTFTSMFPVRCYYEGKYAAHEEIQNPEQVIKRGYWVRLVIEPKSNNATGVQKKGVSLYAQMVEFIARDEEINSGPDAATAFGTAPAPTWRPAGNGSPIPVGAPAAALPPATTVITPPVPVQAPPPPPPVIAPPPPPPVPAAPAGPQYSLAPHMAAAGHTYEGLIGAGWTPEAMVAAGHAVKNY